MRQRRSSSFSASISAVVVALATTTALMAMVIRGSIVPVVPLGNETRRQNEVEMSLLHPGNYSEWAVNGSSVAPHYSTNDQSPSGSGSAAGAGTPGDFDLTHSMMMTTTTTTTVNKLSRSEVTEHVSTHFQSSPSSSFSSSSASFADYGIDVREELRMGGADEGGDSDDEDGDGDRDIDDRTMDNDGEAATDDEDAAAGDTNGRLESRLEVSNLMDAASAPSHSSHQKQQQQAVSSAAATEQEQEAADQRNSETNRKSTSSSFDAPLVVNHSSAVDEQSMMASSSSSSTKSAGGDRNTSDSGSNEHLRSRNYNNSTESSATDINSKSSSSSSSSGGGISWNSGWAINNKSTFNSPTPELRPEAAIVRDQASSAAAPSPSSTSPQSTASTAAAAATSTSVVTRTLITPTAGMRRSHSAPRQYGSSKQYHDHHWGPFFEGPHLDRKAPSNAAETDSSMQVGIHLGTEAFLNCRVGMLRDKTVMWVRKTADKVSLLTVGNNTYSGDSRISIRFQYPNNWRLQIKPVQADDAGLYMCQVSTHPPRVFATNVTILAPAIRVVDEHGHEVHDRYYKMGSAIDLTCQIATTFLAIQPSVAPPPPGNVPLNIPKLTTTTSILAATTRGPQPVFPQIPLPNAIHTFNSYNNNGGRPGQKNNGLIPGGGHFGQSKREEDHYDYLHQKLLWQKDNGSLPKNVQVHLSATPEWRNSRISIAAADKSHSGTYSCSLLNTTLAEVNVQVLNALLPGETPAAVHHNAGGRPPTLTEFGQSPMPIILVLLFYRRFLLSAHIC